MAICLYVYLYVNKCLSGCLIDDKLSMSRNY